MALKQKTISKSVTLSGTGLHTGAEVIVTFHPAPENHGVVFQRIDLPDKPCVKACAEFVIDTARNTIIEDKGARIGMVEHSLSAMAGLEIDNILVTLTGPEMPILDGSARNYLDALLTAAPVTQMAEREIFEIREPIVYSDEERGVEIMALPADDFNVSVMIDYNSAVLGNQFASLTRISDYPAQIAAARTFVFFRELEVLWRSNLIKGGSLDNAMVILEREVTQTELDRVADLIGKPRVMAQAQGILSTTKLEFSNEPARHKLLDLIGDLKLIGVPLKGKVIATRPGHCANVEFAKLVKLAIKKEKTRNIVPSYDPNAAPVYDINRIMTMLPHRPPFLLVDKIIDVTDIMVLGVKNVTMNEPFFVGHFPDEPVMPGVLIVEALAQCGGILVMHAVDNPKEYSTYFLKIDNVRFKRKVVPGDTLVLKMELLEPVRRGIVRMRAQAFVGEQLATEGEMMAQVIRNKEIK
ncbi:MAG: UDP-3-O-[3-hydroxymyristoyl] N-acetylglucosamine deacetylase [Bacteroidetes bacterium GWF2_49_14]|nr:MAG: UDP-3-O-[3-hydroxymyristoyl] N-acetylglucosamine deacetylase [Bacteroidetes bacterium GWF2_49_14]HBB93437.1 UDP-3-O-[3-hydroxymyristoyl] N-acetylglucosamine deacetylase [Bacteroidales bacterium]